MTVTAPPAKNDVEKQKDGGSKESKWLKSK